MNGYQVSPETYRRFLEPLRVYDIESEIYARFLPQSGVIAEYGAGTGALTSHLARRTDSFILAVDLDYRMLSYLAARRNRTRVVPIQADVARLPIQSNTLNGILAPFGFITNFLSRESMGRILMEATRVMSPGAVLLLNCFESDFVITKYGLGIERPYVPSGPPAGVFAELRVDGTPERLRLRFKIKRGFEQRIFEFLVRGWTVEDLCRSAGAAGLTPNGLVDARTGQSPREGVTEEYILSLRKS